MYCSINNDNISFRHFLTANGKQQHGNAFECVTTKLLTTVENDHPPGNVVVTSNSNDAVMTENPVECGVVDPQSRQTTDGIKMDDEDTAHTENKI